MSWCGHMASCVFPNAPGRLLKAHPSIEPLGEPRLQLIEHVVLHGGLQAFMPQGALRLAQIALGELRADEAPEVVRLDGGQAALRAYLRTARQADTTERGCGVGRAPRRQSA